jgi:hypothetical protein
VFKHQENYDVPLDFNRIYPLGSSDFIFSHLGRDLELLSDEISIHGDRIRKDLLAPENYEANRFTLIIAAGYKLLNYKVEFIAATSSKEKRADLLIQGKIIFLVEAKQRNQAFSDKERYSFFGKLTERFLPLLHQLNRKDIFLNIEIKYGAELKTIEKSLFEDIRKLIWRNQKSTNGNYKITLNNLSSHRDFKKILLEGGHLREYPVFTKTEDGFIASDPINQNVVWLNKSINPKTKFPNAFYSLLEDANAKTKNGNRLLLYLDLERGSSDWVDQIAKDILEDMDTYSKDYPNIDGYVISQIPLKFLGKTTIIQPTFNFIGKKSTWSDEPDPTKFFGMQGHTGMDDYLIKDFIMPPGSTLQKYIQCPGCGYILSISGVEQHCTSGK